MKKNIAPEHLAKLQQAIQHLAAADDLFREFVTYVDLDAMNSFDQEEMVSINRDFDDDIVPILTNLRELHKSVSKPKP